MVIDLVGEAFLPEVTMSSIPTMSVFGEQNIYKALNKSSLNVFKKLFPDLDRDEQNDTLKGKK